MKEQSTSTISWSARFLASSGIYIYVDVCCANKLMVEITIYTRKVSTSYTDTLLIVKHFEVISR